MSHRRDIIKKLLQQSISTSLSTSYQIMINKFEILNENMDKVITKNLSKYNTFIIMLNNNQKGQNKKFQRNGFSNIFYKVIGTSFIKTKYHK